MSLKDKTLLVRDTGYFASFAERCARDFGRVIYHNPAWKIGVPKSQAAQMAHELADNIEIALEFWEAVKEADIVACPDIYEGDVQEHLREIGMPVLGSGKGEELEIDRWETKLLLEELGLNVAPSELIEGVDALGTFLEDADECFVKLPRWRGNSETWRHINWFMSQDWFNTLKRELGPSGETMEFVIESPVGDVEAGFDGIIVDGTVLPVCSYGYEIKDAAHVAKFVPYNLCPKPLRAINDAMMPTFEKYQYRGLYSNDVRLADDKKAYLTDPCCRMASPVGELLEEAFENFGEIVWAVAHGEVIQPKIKHTFGAAINLFTEDALRGWVPVMIPKEYRDNVKLHYHSRFDGNDYITPATSGITSVGVIVATGDSLTKVIDKVLEIAKDVQIPGISYDEAAFDSAEKQIEEGRKLGIPW